MKACSTVHGNNVHSWFLKGLEGLQEGLYVVNMALIIGDSSSSFLAGVCILVCLLSV